MANKILGDLASYASQPHLPLSMAHSAAFTECITISQTHRKQSSTSGPLHLMLALPGGILPRGASRLAPHFLQIFTQRSPSQWPAPWTYTVELSSAVTFAESPLFRISFLFRSP